MGKEISLGHPGGPNAITCAYKEERREEERERTEKADSTRRSQPGFSGFEDGGRATEQGGLCLAAGKGKGLGSPNEPPERNAARPAA